MLRPTPRRTDDALGHRAVVGGLDGEFLDCLEGGLGVRQERLAEGGEFHSAVGTFEQPATDGLAQRRQLQVYRRLGVAELFRRTRKAPKTRDRHEGTQLRQLQCARWKVSVVHGCPWRGKRTVSPPYFTRKQLCLVAPSPR